MIVPYIATQVKWRVPDTATVPLAPLGGPCDITHPLSVSLTMKLHLPTVRYYMVVRGLESDADLARAAGWSKAKVSRVLSGKQGVTDVIVKELASALGCKEGEIVELDDVAQTAFQRAVLDGARKAEPNVKAALRALLNIPSDVPFDP